MSVGAGRYSRVTASSMGWTPLFLYAEPRKTGVRSIESVPLRTASWICSSVTVSSRIASISSSENIDTASSMVSRAVSAASCISLGMSFSTRFSPLSPSK